MRLLKMLLILLLPVELLAQQASFASYESYPFPAGLCAAARGEKIAWTLDEQGRRNVYVAEGPAWKPRKLTGYLKDDGQEISSLSISADGQWVVFVRGGEHNSSWSADQPVNPGSATVPFSVQLASVPFSGGEVKYLSEGDRPVLAPDDRTVAFIKDGQVFTVPVDGSSPAAKLFTAAGSTGELEWSGDGKALLFVSGRADHSLIGIYRNTAAAIKWVAPSFDFDNSPHWSTDGKSIVFVRRPGAGGAPQEVLANSPAPWRISIADTASNQARVLWEPAAGLKGTLPSTNGGTNLHWVAGDRIVFLAYADGWPHIYSISAKGGQAQLLTPGPFMCEHIKVSADQKHLTFSVNSGNDPSDMERRHIAMVSVDRPDMRLLTGGSGLEWMPVLTGDGKTAAFISATAQRPPLASILNLTDSKNKLELLGADRIPASFPQERLVIPKTVVFTSPDGVIVHAELFLPAGAPSRKPAIVYVHGGPSAQMLGGWHYSDYYANAYAANQYLASQGFVVLAVNYRLGTGYGFDFQQPNHAGYKGASEYQDIKAAGEWLQKQSFVDAQKIGIYGSSYGGYLTALALARDSKIFAAGVDIHGIHDWLVNPSILGVSSNVYEKAPDYDLALQTAWRSSPVSSASTWTSPVLIIHGDDDRNVDFSQSTNLVARLAKYGVPFETLIIPDDSHHWMKWSNVVAVYGAVADFFIRKMQK